jgi:hypothetical protein
MYMDKILAFFLLGRLVKVYFPNLDQVLDVVGDLVCSSDLLWELPFVDHAFSMEETEDEDVALCEGRITSSAEEVCILMGWSA